MIDHTHSLSLRIRPPFRCLAVEVDGEIATYVTADDNVEVTARPDAARVVRLGRTTSTSGPSARLASPAPESST